MSKLWWVTNKILFPELWKGPSLSIVGCFINSSKWAPAFKHCLDLINPEINLINPGHRRHTQTNQGMPMNTKPSEVLYRLTDQSLDFETQIKHLKYDLNGALSKQRSSFIFWQVHIFMKIIAHYVPFYQWMSIFTIKYNAVPYRRNLLKFPTLQVF